MDCCRERCVDKCCCCIELRLGLIIFGVLNAICGISGVVAAFVIAEYSLGMIFQILYVSYCAVIFCVSIVFVYGAVKRKSSIINMYSIFMWVFVVWALVILIYVLVKFGWLNICTNLIVCIPWYIYGFVVCRSYYEKFWVTD